MEIRLQKWLAKAGVASRRKAEELIAAGRVTVNGQPVSEMGAKAHPEHDTVCLDGVPLLPDLPKLYIMLHKPEGVVTTVTDPRGRATVMDVLRRHPPYGADAAEPPSFAGCFPVGRLDYDTSGLLLITNHGDWAHRITHPSHQVDKTYLARLQGVPGRAALTQLVNGIDLDGQRTAPCRAALLPPRPQETNARVRIIIHEGRNRQVRRMCETIGHPVLSLKRVALGSLQLGALPKGRWRFLSPQEVEALCHPFHTMFSYNS